MVASLTELANSFREHQLMRFVISFRCQCLNCLTMASQIEKLILCNENALILKVYGYIIIYKLTVYNTTEIFPTEGLVYVHLLCDII